jgi:hypothetical protein
MKKYQKEKEEKIDQIVKKIVNLFKNYQIEEETTLVAICENENPAEYELAQMFIDQKSVILGKGFEELSTNDKLIVVKATINAHRQLAQGELPYYGKILHYELRDNSPTYRAFDLNGEYMSIFK